MVPRSLPLPTAAVDVLNGQALPWLRQEGIELVLPLELDEYAFSTKGDGSTLADVAWGIFNVSADNGIATVHLPFHEFGSSGHAAQPASVREGFAAAKRDPSITLGRSIARVAAVQSLGLHVHATTGVRVDWALGATLGFQLNHHPIQSRERFGRRTPGRNWGYFARADWAEVEDTALSECAKSWREGRAQECYPPTPRARSASPTPPPCPRPGRSCRAAAAWAQAPLRSAGRRPAPLAAAPTRLSTSPMTGPPRGWPLRGRACASTPQPTPQATLSFTPRTPGPARPACPTLFTYPARGRPTQATWTPRPGTTFSTRAMPACRPGQRGRPVAWPLPSALLRACQS